MNFLHESAKIAFSEGNYKVAAKNWIIGNSLPDNHEEIEEIFDTVYDLNKISPDPNLFAILGLIALDYHEIINGNRKEALYQCVEWSREGIRMDPDHYFCNRHAGSAFYWMGEYDKAIQYYEKAVSLVSSPLLQLRIFIIRNQSHSNPDFSSLEINTETLYALEAYNAGVEINSLLRQYHQMPEDVRCKLLQIKKKCYHLAYQLYRQTLVEKKGNSLNNDPHTFAMCCNNLSTEMRKDHEFESAIKITSEGMEYSYFMYILQNRFGSYIEGGYFEEAVKDGERLLEDFISEMDVNTYFNIVDHLCNCLMHLKNYQSAMYWINNGLDSYYSLDPSDGATSNPEIVQIFTNFFINKTKAEEALGISAAFETASKETDNLLEAMPDNPSILIGKANIFIDEEKYAQAVECLRSAVNFATEQQKERSLQVALYNLGYIFAAKLKDENTGLENFEKSIFAGNNDFWCLYWTAHCAYHLHENQKTIKYAAAAIEVFPDQIMEIKHDIIAELYEHMGTAQFDLGDYENAVDNLRTSLGYHHSKVTEDNLKAAEKKINGQPLSVYLKEYLENEESYIFSS